jgi:hypothetical protein
MKYSQNDGKEAYVFGTKVSVKLNDQIGSSNTPILYTLPGSSLGSQYMLPCYFTGGKVVWDEAALKIAFHVTDNVISGTNNVSWKNIETNYCIMSNRIVSQSVYTTACSSA